MNRYIRCLKIFGKLGYRMGKMYVKHLYHRIKWRTRQRKWRRNQWNRGYRYPRRYNKRYPRRYGYRRRW